MAACFALAAAACARSGAPISRFDPHQLTELLDLLSEPSTEPARLQQLVERIPSPGDASPIWPLFAYLRGEALKRAGRPEAVEVFRQLARWGARRPYGDQWGGSSLAALGLWRWLESLEAADRPRPDEVEEILRIDETLRKESRLVRGLFDASWLDSLPLVEEDSVRRLAALAQRAGRQAKAHRIFVEYLTLSRAPDLDPAQQRMLDEMVEAREASREALLALRAGRLEDLRNYAAALELWARLAATGGAPTRALAGLHQAKIQYRLPGASRAQVEASRAQVERLLDGVLEEAVDPDVIQEALLTRALNWSKEGRGQDYQHYFDDLAAIVRRFPNGVLADDALYRSGVMHWRLFELTGDDAQFTTAQKFFEQVRAFAGQNDWLASAHFSPALALILRGRDDDLRQAVTLLETLNRLQPDGELHRLAAFWRARAIEALGSQERARGAFLEVWKEHRYDYYGVRARMHWRLGRAAGGRLWPDPETRKELREAWERAPGDPAIEGRTPYHGRLQAALDAGLYQRALDARAALRRHFADTRISEVPLERLEQTGLLPALALLLSLRQDASAAGDALPDALNHLSVIAAVGRRAGDWPMATALALGAVGTHESSEMIEVDPRFLRCAYAPVFRDALTRAGRDRGIPVELLYAVARRESALDPEALSSSRALGLFQFLPTTFDDLDRRWKLLAESRVGSREAYLLSVELSSALAARWFSDELLPTLSRERILVDSPSWFADSLTADQQRLILLSLMSHSAGNANVRSWLDRWKKQGRQDDLEYMVETAGATETRLLVRGILTDASIASAVDLFQPAPR